MEEIMLTVGNRFPNFSPENTIRFITTIDSSIKNNLDEALRELDILQTNGLCQYCWTRGQKTINIKNAEV
jgi:alkyl hydroperoxide reductase subunit AhpC